MSSNVPIAAANDLTAPTPQNTPLNQAPISLGLSRPTVPDISEETEPQDKDADGKATGIAGLVSDKISELLGASSGYLESLPLDVKLNVEGLKGVQTKYVELQAAFKKECLELEKKYLKLAQPIYERRKAIVTGTAPATEEEIAAGEAAEKKEDEDYETLARDAAPSADGIPQFWLTALNNHPGLSELITERDVEALKALVDVRIEYLQGGDNQDSETQGKEGYKIIFDFLPNEFFENTQLTKTYLYAPELSYAGDFIYDRAIGTKIQWKDDKDLTKEFEIKKQRNKNTNRTRLVRKAKPIDSFFNFFSPPTPPTEEQIENGDIDGEEFEDLEDKLEIDYQIGEDLKDKIIPRAVDFFTGKIDEYDLDDDEDYEDEDDEDEDEEDFDEDDDSESDNDVPARRRGGRKPRRGGAPSTTNPDECKQQ